MVEQDFKSIRIELDFADENGKRTKKEQTVKVNKPSLKDKSSWRYHIKSIYTLSFTIQIPDFIHSYLIGKSVPSSRSEKTKDYNEDFAKSINRASIEQLTEMWCEVINDFVWLKKMEQADLKKVIFYQFDNNKNNYYKSCWNGIEFGELSELGYKYAIGYISDVEKNQIRYNSERLSVSSSHDTEFYRLKYVEWTMEREVFFVNIQKSFEAISKKITEFESSITEETINGLIANSPLQLIKQT